MASRNSRGSRRWLAPVVATVAALSVGYYVYQKLSATDATKETPGKATPKQTVPQTTKISIVVSRSLLEQGIPLELLLRRYPELVIVTAPNITTADDRLQLNSQVPASEKHRVIPCETQIGIVHVLKHLRADRVILPSDIPANVPVDITRFVGSVTQLSTDPGDANEQMRELIG